MLNSVFGVSLWDKYGAGNCFYNDEKDGGGWWKICAVKKKKVYDQIVPMQLPSFLRSKEG